MENDLTPVDHLMRLVKERQQLLNICNRQIAELISPSVLTALFELLDLASDRLIWEDFQVMDDVLMIQATVVLDSDQPRSPFLTVITASVDEQPATQVKKRIQFGIPVSNVFRDKDDLKQWFLEVVQVADIYTDSGDTERNDDHLTAECDQLGHVDFDKAILTADQLAQLLFHEKQNKGTQ